MRVPMPTMIAHRSVSVGLAPSPLTAPPHQAQPPPPSAQSNSALSSQAQRRPATTARLDFFTRRNSTSNVNTTDSMAGTSMSWHAAGSAVNAVARSTSLPLQVNGPSDLSPSHGSADACLQQRTNSGSSQGSRGGVSSRGGDLSFEDNDRRSLIAEIIALKEELRSTRDENKSLREELSRAQSDTLGVMRRRSMAAIAGGGFRGSSSATPRDCQCDALKMKLARLRVEMRKRRAVEHNEFNSLLLPPGELEALPQTPKLPEVSPELAEAEVQTIAQSAVDVSSQTKSSVTIEASVQATAVKCEVAGIYTQTETAKAVGIETQTLAVHVAHVAVEAMEARPTLGEVSAQTDSPGSSDASAQVGVPAMNFVDSTSQTSSVPRLDVSTQATQEQDAIRQKCDADVQTAALPTPVLRDTAAQTSVPAARPTASVQVSPFTVDRSVQAEDKAAAQQQSKVTELQVLLQELTDENLKLAEKIQKTQQMSDAWQHVAHKKLFGQMNVTVLCPRAECNVNGQRVEMDGWDPVRLRKEFEKEVIPRFTRIFVVEETPDRENVKNTAMDQAMQEFAEVFRSRLTVMLSAPNARAAASAGPSRGSGR